MSFKIVQGATPTNGPSLCKTCKFSWIVTGQNNEEVVTCEVTGDPQRMRFKVSTCTKFAQFGVPSLYDMRQIAWNIEAKKRGPTGFGAPPSKEGDMELVISPPKKHVGTYSPEDDEVI